MKNLVAIVRLKGSKDYQSIARTYPSKKSFYEDLKMNGFKVRKIYTQQEYEKL